jgi:hypothetical protein
LHTQLAKKLAGRGDPFLGHLSGFQNFAGIHFLSSVREVFGDAGQRKPHVRLNIVRLGIISAASRRTNTWPLGSPISGRGPFNCRIQALGHSPQ